LSYKTILVHIDAGERWRTRLHVAARLQQRFESHLVGLYALSSAHLPGFTLPEMSASLAEVRKITEGWARRAREEFDRLTGLAGLTNAEWRASPEDAAAAVPLHARYADLVVIGQPDPEQPAGLEASFAHRVVLAASRPVLVIPYAGEFDVIGKRVLLAWNASREAARAATDSLPMLRAADRVTVVCINPKAPLHGEQPGADIALYLARHGVRSEVSNLQGSDIDAGNQLLSYAADLSADLIVMGAYGHSRLSEVVLGGVTRTLMGSMTVPVLMAH
jgi:nucleotide-binding universal stress UspA family protein